MSCSCVFRTPEEAYDDAQWVSRALVLSKRQQNMTDFVWRIIYTVRYITVFKNVKGSRPLCPQIWTAPDTAACGVPFLEPGKQYLLAGSFDDDSKPTINLCTPLIGPWNASDWENLPKQIKTKLGSGTAGRKSQC
ncbi:Metalloproteinase inhibitor 2 [Toxocara canis]|nr:Metalloproteinase inhibitor 2 [Toxocara canis]